MALREREAINNPASNKRRKKKKKYGFVIAVMSLLGIAVIVLSMTVFFNIKTIKVVGEKPYTDEEIISASTLGIGKNMFSIDKFKIIENLKKKLPYLDEVLINRKLPDGVVISVTSAKSAVFVTTGGGYVVVSNKNKVLENTAEKPNLPELYGSEIVANTVGETAVFTSDFTTDIYSQLLFALGGIENGGKVTFIDVSRSYKMSFKYNDNIYVNLGGSNDFQRKIKFLNYIFSKEDITSGYAAIDLSNVSEQKGSYTPLTKDEFDEKCAVVPPTDEDTAQAESAFNENSPGE